MGSVKKYLYKGELPERESHHSRLFVDLAENIHIHHREYRTVFSLDEYFEYADIIEKSTVDVRNFLEQNSEYREGQYPTTIMIAGGKERQLKYLENSPKPNRSKYFFNDFAIELQDEYVTDEIHIHYRDFRIAMDRDRFRDVAKGFKEALDSLNEFEHENHYVRQSHSDRIIKNYNSDDTHDSTTKQMGVGKLPLNEIKSAWYKNIAEEMRPNKKAISLLMEEFNNKGEFVPIIVSTELNGDHLIVDGHHRFFAAVKMNLYEIDAIVINMTHEESKHLRKALVSLTEFDIQTNYEYSLSSFMRSFLGYKLNKYYSGVFHGKIREVKYWYRVLRKIKRVLLGKRYIFKSFNETHND